MSIEIRETDALSDEDCRRLYEWGDDIFGSGGLHLEWRPKERHFLLFEDSQLMSHVGVLRHAVAVGGRPVTVAGVGGVVTVPEAQKKGFAALLMRRAAAFIAGGARVEAGFLFCLPHMVAYYEKLDWRKIGEPVFIEQPAGRLESPIGAMILPVGDFQWPAGAIELNSWPW